MPPPNRIRKEDVSDADFVDSYELASDGYGPNSVYLTGVTVVSTTSGTKTVVVNLAPDGGGLYYSMDHPVQETDIVWLSGTSGGTADGYYTVASIIDDLTFTVNEVIANSTGGIAEFRYTAGAFKVGFNKYRYPAINVTHTNVQEAIQDLDLAISTGGGLTPVQHETLRQLIHLADGVGGPFEGFPTNAFREILPTADPFPTSITWWTSSAKVARYVDKTITYNSNTTPATIQWRVYGNDGVTVLSTVTDTISYSGIFETSRTRGIIDGYPVPAYSLNAETHKYVRQLIHLADGVGGPFEGFSSGAYRETLPVADPFPTSVIWYDDNTKTKTIVEKLITYNGNSTVNTVIYKVYDTDGTTILATATDTISYSGVFEIDRTRTIV